MRITAILMSLALTAFGTGADAQDGQPSAHLQLREDMVRMARVDAALTAQLGDACAVEAAESGLRIDSIDAYPATARDAASAALELSALAQVYFVASGSAADLAGVKAGDEFLTLYGLDPAQAISTTEGVSLADRIERFLSQRSAGEDVQLVVRRDDRTLAFTLTPRMRCRHVAVVAVDEDVKAYSDATGLAVTTGLMRSLRNDDELAVVVGHELAHIALYDYFRDARIRGKRKEDIVDAIGTRLAGCAGYDLAKGLQFWLHYDEARRKSFLPSFTHRSSKKRFRAAQPLIADQSCDTLQSDIAALHASRR